MTTHRLSAMSASKLVTNSLRGIGSTSTAAPWRRSLPISAASRCLSLAPRRRIIDSSPSTTALPSSISRHFSTSQMRWHGHVTPPKPGEELYVTFVDKDDKEHRIAVAAGDNLLDIAQANDLEMEGACGGSCACSTCHVIVVGEDYYDKMPEPEDDENDMLDLAFGLTETSRLGCQVAMTKELDGLRVKLPSMTRNLQASDFTSR